MQADWVITDVTFVEIWRTWKDHTCITFVVCTYDLCRVKIPVLMFDIYKREDEKWKELPFTGICTLWCKFTKFPKISSDFKNCKIKLCTRPFWATLIFGPLGLAAMRQYQIWLDTNSDTNIFFPLKKSSKLKNIWTKMLFWISKQLTFFKRNFLNKIKSDFKNLSDFYNN